MKAVSLFFSSAAILAFVFCKAPARTPRQSALITAGSLYCREAPKSDAASVTLLTFGTPVYVETADSQLQTLDGKLDRWYRTDLGCWVFGGYLSLSKDHVAEPALFAGELVQCDIPLDGLWSNVFSPFVIDDQYVAFVNLSLYPSTDGPTFGIEIGRVARSQDDWTFTPQIIGTYRYPDASWMGVISATNRQAIHFYSRADTSGTYFVTTESKIPRDRARKICSEFGKQEVRGQLSIFETYNEMRPTTPEAIRKSFPIVALRNNRLFLGFQGAK